MPLLTGTLPNQIPTNADLGGMALQDPAAVSITGGSIMTTPSVTQGDFTNTNMSNVKPTLLLDFGNGKRLDPRVTFTRASTGLCYDGRTQAVAEQNLLAWSQDFSNAVWSKNGITSVGGSIAPNGTLTAFQFFETATSAIHFLGLSAGTPITSGLPYTFSAYLKKGSSPASPSLVYYCAFSGAFSCGLIVNLDLGTVLPTSTSYATVAASSITAVGNGWYRVSFTALAFGSGVPTNLTSVAFINNLASNAQGANAANIPAYQGDATANVYVWGAQVEQRNFSTPYIATSGVAVTNYVPVPQQIANDLPRFDHSPVTNECLGLLVEEARTNLLLASSDLYLPGYWTTNNASVIGNVAIGPDGLLSADKLVPGTATSYASVTGNVTGTAVAYTQSFYVKMAGFRFIQLAQTANANYANFDLLLGTVVAGTYTTATVTPVGNSWFRVSATFTYSAAAIGVMLVVIGNPLDGRLASFQGNGVDGILVWAAQCELGATLTSYIPTPSVWGGRGSAGTYLTGNGTLGYAQAGTLRYQPNSLGTLSPMIEGAGANLSHFTSFATSAGWSLQGANLSSNMTVAPDGTFTAAIISTAAAGVVNLIAKAITTTASTAYVFSVYAKYNGARFIVLRLYDGVTSWYAYFDILNGVLGTGGVTSTLGAMQYVSNGWYRCYIKSTLVGTAGNILLSIADADNTQVVASLSSSAYVWGLQYETGSVATSYIPSQDTFVSRAGPATYYDPSTVALAEQNLALYSQDYTQSAWTKTNVTISASAALAPDGTMTASLVNSASTTNPQISQSIVVVSGAYYVVSFYARQGSERYFQLRDNQSAADYAIFDLQGGTVTQNGSFYTTSMTSIGNGWYRCVAVISNAVFSAGNVAFTLAFTDNRATPGLTQTITTTSGLTFYLWGFQVEQRSAVSAYVPTTTTAITNYIPQLLTAPAGVPRYDFDPVTRLSRGLTLEAAATNLMSYSNDLTNVSVWNKSLSSISNNNIAPDGTLNASFLMMDSTAGLEHRVYQTFTSVTSTTYCYSVFAKASSMSNFLLLTNEGSNHGCCFNLQTGVMSPVGTIVSNSITSVGNGWYRCIFTRTATGTLNRIGMTLVDSGTNTLVNGDGRSGMWFWGAQVETGSVATSYIPTTTVAVTRAADVSTSVAMTRAADTLTSAVATRAVETATATSPTGLNPLEGTVLATFQSQAVGTRPLISIDNGTASEQVRLYTSGTSTEFTTSSGNVTQADLIPGLIQAQGTARVGVCYANQNFCASLNGNDALTNLTSNVPQGLTTIRIGADAAGNVFNGPIKRLAYYPKNLGTAEVQELALP